MSLSSSSSLEVGLTSTIPITRRKSVMQQIGNWLSNSPEPDTHGKRLLQKMPTFRKRVQAGRKQVYDVGGKKTITYWGAHVYLLNQFLDCLPSLPYVILAAGWIPALVANIFVCSITSFIALMTMRAMTMIEGNQNFELRYEYVPTAQHFLGPTVAICLEIGFHVLQILNFLAINSVSRLIDIMLLKGLGFTAGVSLYPSLCFIWISNGGNLEDLYTASNAAINFFTISLGYIICGVVCIPLSRYNLNEGLSAQLGIFGVALIAISVVIGSAIKTLLTAATLPSIFKALPSWLLHVCQLSLNLDESSTSVTAISQSPAQYNRKAFLQAVGGLDPFSLIPILGTIGNNSEFLKLVKESPLTNMCSVCISSLCLEAASHYAESPLLWDPLLQHLVAASWKIEKLGPRPTAPSRWGQYKFQRTFAIFIGGYSFTNVLPSWANELQANIEIPKVVWCSTISACCLFFGFGWLLAFAFPDIDDEDALQHIVGNHQLPNYVTFSVYSLELVTVALGLIVNCIATRYNLTNSGVFQSPSMAFFFGCVCPFLFAWIFAAESWVTACFGWASLILSLVCNFVAPAYVYIVACKTSPLAYRNPSRHKTVRLGIEAFVPQRGSIPDVQAALREWALTMTEEDSELRALLESSDADSLSFALNTSLRKRSSQSSIRPLLPPRKLPLLKFSKGRSHLETSRHDSHLFRALNNISETLLQLNDNDFQFSDSDQRNKTYSPLSYKRSLTSDHQISNGPEYVNFKFQHPLTESFEGGSNDIRKIKLTKQSPLACEAITQDSFIDEFSAERDPHSPILNDIRRRFTVMEIIESYQKATSMLSTYAEEAVKKSILSQRGSGHLNSNRSSASENLIRQQEWTMSEDRASAVLSGWRLMVSNYKKRFATSELDNNGDDTQYHNRMVQRSRVNSLPKSSLITSSNSHQDLGSDSASCSKSVSSQVSSHSGSYNQRVTQHLTSVSIKNCITSGQPKHFNVAFSIKHRKRSCSEPFLLSSCE